MTDQKYFPVYEGHPPIAELPGKNLYADAIREAQRDGAKELAQPMYFYKEGKEKVGQLTVLPAQKCSTKQYVGALDFRVRNGIG